MISALGDRSFQRPELLDDPDPVVGDVAQAGQLAGDDRQNRQPDDPVQAPRQVGECREQWRRAGSEECLQSSSHVLNKRRAHGKTPLVNERDPAAPGGTPRDETQPAATYPTFGARGIVRPPRRESIRRPHGILEEIAPEIFGARERPLTIRAFPSTLTVMGYEVELKYRLADPAALERRLAAQGADRGPEIRQEDIYLSHPSRDFATTHEALRIRRIGAENRITYKGPRLSGPTKTREEIEIPLGSGEEAFQQLARFFENLGFRPVATIRKSRTPFHLRRQGQAIEIVLDRVVGLGQFAEIETLAETETALPAAQGAILGLAVELGLTEVEPRSYLRMSLESGRPGS